MDDVFSYLQATGSDFDVLSVQEVTLRTPLEPGSFEFVEFPEFGYKVLFAHPKGCFRPVAIACDSDSVTDISNVSIGLAHVSAVVQIRDGPTILVSSVHLPHNKRSYDDFVDGLQMLQHCIQQHSEVMPVILAGDLNYPLVGDLSARGHCLLSGLLGLGLHHYSQDTSSTRVGGTRRLDHIVFNDRLASPCTPVGCEEFPYAVETLHSHSMGGLGVDHMLIQLEFLLGSSRGAVRAKHRSRARGGRRYPHVGKYACKDLDTLHSLAAPLLQKATQGLVVTHDDLKDLARQATYKTYPLRYQDTPEIKDLCRLRSVTHHGPERARISGQIFKQRRQAKQQWTKELFHRASNGDWQAKQTLQRPRVKAGGLLHYAATKTDAKQVVDEVRNFFREKFESGSTSLPGPFPWDADTFSLCELPNQEEVQFHVCKMKLHKTTGVSGISADLLHSILQLPHGSLLVHQLVHGILIGSQRHFKEMYDGLVILVPKILQVVGPHQLRPIVLLETCLKLVARIVTQRILDSWPIPDSMMGARAGGQVAEVAWWAKLMLARKRVYDSPCVFLKLDLASAFDSLNHSAIQQEMMAHFTPAQGVSCRWFSFMMKHQTLLFQILEEEFSTGMHRGTVQGGTHSPGVFSRVVALAADRLQAKWELAGEEGPFLAGDRFLWFLWFVDDGLVSFKNPKQLVRLLPQLRQCLLDLGLQLNLAKCKLLGWPSSQSLPVCLHGVQVVAHTTFLGCVLTTQPEAELCFLQGLLQRAVRGFFTNRKLLCHPDASRPKKLQLFQTLVVSTFRWALGAVVPSRGILQAARVQGTTLMVWLLGLAVHRAWYSPEMLAQVRHIAKMWQACYSTAWDQLLLMLHFRLIGHMVRSSSVYISAGAGDAEVLTSAARGGQRRRRTGPDLSGARRLRAFLQGRGVELKDAISREKWQQLEGPWIQSFGLSQVADCVQQVHQGHMMWSVRCLQGVAYGSQTFYFNSTSISELRMKDGWVLWPMETSENTTQFMDVAIAQCMKHTVHLRIFSRFPLIFDSVIRSRLQSNTLVCEWSLQESLEEAVLPFACEAFQAPMNQWGLGG